MIVLTPCESPVGRCSCHAQDELEDVELWVDLLADGQTDKSVKFNVILLFDREDVEHQSILGGAVCEYYPGSNCGLLTYFAVNPNVKGRGLGRILVREVLAILHADAASGEWTAFDAIASA